MNLCENIFFKIESLQTFQMEPITTKLFQSLILFLKIDDHENNTLNIHGKSIYHTNNQKYFRKEIS